MHTQTPSCLNQETRSNRTTKLMAAITIPTSTHYATTTTNKSNSNSRWDRRRHQKWSLMDTYIWYTTWIVLTSSVAAPITQLELITISTKMLTNTQAVWSNLRPDLAPPTRWFQHLTIQSRTSQSTRLPWSGRRISRSDSCTQEENAWDEEVINKAA